VEVKEHNQIDKHPPAELHEHSRTSQEVDEHGGHQQRQQSPLVIIVGHVSRSPSSQEVLEQPEHLLSKRILEIRSSISAPPAVGAVGSHKRTALGHDPGYNEGNRRGHDETRRAAEGTLADGGKRAQTVSISRELHGFQRADITGQEGENRNTDTALPRDTEKW
jgi:hypothetical protein